MATAEEAKPVIMLPASPFFAQLSDADRLRAMDRIILATRMRVVLAKATNLKPLQPFDKHQQEALVNTYLQLGSLERRPPEQLMLVIFSLVKGQAKPAFPPEILQATEQYSFDRALEVAGKEQREVLSRVLQFCLEAVKKGWLERQFVSEMLTDALLNYKTTKKTFARFTEFVNNALSVS